MPDISGNLIPLFQSYTGLNNGQYFDDTGIRQLLGTNAADYILGLAGNDRLLGLSGNDLLSGGAGDDQIEGRAGADVLAGGPGIDQLTGGDSNDRFTFSSEDFPANQSFIPDRLIDFNQGNNGTFSSAEGDLIDISSVHSPISNGFYDFATVRLRAVAASGGAPAAALLQILTATGDWQTIVSLDGVTAGQTVNIALTDEQALAGTGTAFTVETDGGNPAWTITPSSPSVTEANTTVTFTITRAGAGLPDETVYVSTTMNHGFYNDRDYTGRANVEVHFATGETTHTFTVAILNDTRDEPDEVFGLIVQRDPNDPLSTYLASTTFTILDNDAPVTPVTGSTYIGDDLANNWVGTTGNDYASGVGGNDSLTSGAGDDYLEGGIGNDTLYGGTGDDIIDAGNGRDVINAGDGDDIVYVNGAGADAINGGLGVDYLSLDCSDLTLGQTIIFEPEGSFVLSDGTSVSGFEMMELATGSGNDTLTMAPTPFSGHGYYFDNFALIIEPYFSAGSGTDRAILDFSGLSQSLIFSSPWSDSFQCDVNCHIP